MLKVNCAVLLNISTHPSTDTVAFGKVLGNVTVHVDRDWVGKQKDSRVLADLIDDTLETDTVCVDRVLRIEDVTCVDCGRRCDSLTDTCACFGREAVA